MMSQDKAIVKIGQRIQRFGVHLYIDGSNEIGCDCPYRTYNSCDYFFVGPIRRIKQSECESN
jgi:hypothetical protein